MDGNLDELRRLAGVSESDEESPSRPWLTSTSVGTATRTEENVSSDEEMEPVVNEKKTKKKAVKIEEDELSGEEEEEIGSEEESDDRESGEEDDSMNDEDLESGDEEDEGEDDEEDDDEDGDDEDMEDDVESDAAAASLSESDGESEKCPICLGRFQGQDIGTPESCDHTFCLECIEEWSKNVNTCPVDRQVFHLIFARHEIEGKIFKQIKVQDRQLPEEEGEDDSTDCEICGRSDREDRLLLCDGCDLGYHCECLDPPIDTIPVDEWFCPDCAQDRNARIQAEGRALAEEVDDSEEIMFMINENRNVSNLPALRPQRRQVARTRQSERVRAAIQQLRETRARVRHIITRLQSSDDEQEAGEAVADEAGPSSRSSTVTRTTRKRSTKRKTRRKTTKRRSTTKKKTTTKKTSTSTTKKKKVPTATLG